MIHDKLIERLPLTDFESFLMDKHGEDYIGTDDMMPDAFNNWIQDLSVDDWMDYGNEYRNLCTEALKKVKFGLDVERIIYRLHERNSLGIPLHEQGIGVIAHVLNSKAEEIIEVK